MMTSRKDNGGCGLYAPWEMKGNVRPQYILVDPIQAGIYSTVLLTNMRETYRYTARDNKQKHRW